LLFLSSCSENLPPLVVAIVYAIMTTRNEHITWEMRAIRVLPMFVLPAVSSVIYSTVVKFTRMLERKDQKTLEKLRAERKAKIDELKERTNYYLTQQLIQVSGHYSIYRSSELGIKFYHVICPINSKFTKTCKCAEI
jgi:hypothetical protein